MLAIAGSASAALVNGDFSSTTIKDDNRINDVDIGIGWATNGNGEWDIIGGAGTKTKVGARCIGQLYTDSQTGPVVLKFDYTGFIDGAGTVILVGYTGSGAYNYQDEFAMNNNSIPSGDLYTITTLINDTTTVSGSGTYSSPFTADGTYANYGVKVFTAANIGATIANVAILPIPEPALLGFLGLGVLAFVRRK